MNSDKTFVQIMQNCEPMLHYHNNKSNQKPDKKYTNLRNKSTTSFDLDAAQICVPLAAQNRLGQSTTTSAFDIKSNYRRNPTATSAKKSILKRRKMTKSVMQLNNMSRWMPKAMLTIAASILVLALAINAVHANSANQQYSAPPQQQPIDGYGSSSSSSAAAPVEPAYAGGPAAGPSKAKKIQIVYIKVPLTKLKPSLAGSDYSNNQSSNQTSASYDANTNTIKTQHGSQSSAFSSPSSSSSLSSQSQEFNSSEQQQRLSPQSSFLIPMAVVQSVDSSQSASAAAQSNDVNNANVIDWLQSAPASAAPTELPVAPVRANGARRPRQEPSSDFQPMFSIQNLFGSGNGNSNSQPMMMLHQPSVNHGINHGFMSSFLSGEKDKMMAAAMRLHQSQPHMQSGPQSLSTAASSQTGQTTPIAVAPASSPSSNQQQPNQILPVNQGGQQNQHSPNNGPGGLMPIMMMPFSHMPDNMIGQAYNAAVGQALPVESAKVKKISAQMKLPELSLVKLVVIKSSKLREQQPLQSTNVGKDDFKNTATTGSPSSMLSSPSTVAQADNSYGTKQQANSNNNQQQPQQYSGGNSGTAGDAGYSSGAASSGSYGANGPSHSENISSGNKYRQSASGSGNSGPSSGYGNGISTSGGSGPSSGYQTGQSTGLGPQQQQHQNNGYNNAQRGPQNQAPAGGYNSAGQGSIDGYNAEQKLRQAKKTIIPIVVQVEHAILENNALNAAYQNAAATAAGYNANSNNNNNQNQNNNGHRGNRYSGAGRGYRQLAGGSKKRGRQQENYGNNQQSNNVPYGAASNEIGLGALEVGANNAQFINAANMQDINRITAQINAENAASAAAALAQADMTIGNGSPPYLPRPAGSNNVGHMQYPQQQSGIRPLAAQYASGLQSAASSILANSHPMIQAAASGGLASVSKLGAKLGEMIALPSMQMPNSIQSIGSSFPSALSSITNQMGAQMNQAIQQVAKEHPTSLAIARQVAQHAGINLPSFVQQASNGPQNQGQQGQQQAAASNQHPVQSLSPQAQLQNLKQSLGVNLQSAAAQLIGVHSKNNAQNAASLLASPIAALYPPSVSAALKQLTGGIGVQQASGLQSVLSPNVGNGPQNGAGPGGIDPHHAQSSSLVPVQEQLSAALVQQFQQQVNQQANGASPDHSTSQQASSLIGQEQAKQAGKASTFKTKFLSFFQPPKFISSLLSWNDRVDDREDHGKIVPVDMAIPAKNESSKAETKTEQSELTVKTAPVVATSTTLADTSASSSSTMAASSVSAAAATTATRTSVMPVETSSSPAPTTGASFNSTNGLTVPAKN